MYGQRDGGHHQDAAAARYAAAIEPRYLHAPTAGECGAKLGPPTANDRLVA